MRKRRKIETVRIRKAKETVTKQSVLYFVKDGDVSNRILAILSVGKPKIEKKEDETRTITYYKVICGSNGKIGTRYNVVKNNGYDTMNKQLTDDLFVKLYPLQCEIFKKIFNQEYKLIYDKLKGNV